MSLTVEQLAERRTGLGGSDIAAALGLSPYKTAMQLYLEKRGEWDQGEPPEDSEVQWWGRMLEPIVRQRYAEETGRIVVMPPGTLRHPVHSFLLAHVDGLIDGERRGYEGKTAFHSFGWGEEGTDQIPLPYLLQVHAYLTVTAYEVWDVCTLIGRRFKFYEVAADAEMSEMIIAGAADFMRRVKENDPPPLDYRHSTAIDVVKRLYPGTNGARLPASADAIAWRASLEAAQVAKKSAESSIAEMKARLLEEMGEAALLAFPDGKCFRRQTIQRAAYSVEATSYMDFRLINDGKAPALKRKQA